MQKTPHAVAAALGERVRARRQQIYDASGKVLSQERLAERAGLHRTYIGHVERGEVNIALLNLVRIAEALECDPGDLVTGLRPEIRRLTASPHVTGQ